MASDIFRALLLEQVDIFRAAFSTTATEVFLDKATGRLRHTGEYGMFRESVVRDFLKFVVPRSFDMSTGFVITSKGSVSTQCDVVIFDSRSTPLYVEGDRQRFFPIESIRSIGEVKSTLNRSELAAALNKLAKIKQLSDQVQSPAGMGAQLMGPFNPVDNPFDLVPSFLICQRFNFDHSRLEEELDSMYEAGIEHRHKHNIILSIDDGVLCYSSAGGHLPYPRLNKQDNRHRFVLPTDADRYVHFSAFTSFMFQTTSNRTALYPEISDYIGPTSGGICREQSNRPE